VDGPINEKKYLAEIQKFKKTLSLPQQKNP